jgi:hypothetical protein
MKPPLPWSCPTPHRLRPDRSTAQTYGSRLIPERRSKARVRVALETMLAEHDADDLIDETYSHRSETPHEGKLHSLEKSFGLQRERMVGELDPEMGFTYSLLDSLRDATRRPLLSALGAD